MAVRTMLDTVKEHLFSDKELERRKSDIYDLERAVSHAIYFSSAQPKKKNNQFVFDATSILFEIDG